MKLNKDGKPRKKRILSRQIDKVKARKEKERKKHKAIVVQSAPKKPSRHIPIATRRLVMERDGNKCTRCGTVDDLIFHHKIPWGEGGTHEPDNLQVLCMACHKSVHLERGDFYAHKMASTKRELVEGVRDYARSTVQVVSDIKGLESDFGLSNDDAWTVYWIRFYSLQDVYPSIANLANAMDIDELVLASRMLVLRAKELLFTTVVPERQNCYTLAKAKLNRYFAIKITYYDANDNVIRIEGGDTPQSKLAREADIPVRIITGKEG